MNDQLIGDLFAEATRRMTGSSSREFSQKFAELIVEECATVIERNLFQGIGWNTSRAVKRHFGIGDEE
jgi:hypothetical protein